MPAKPPPAAGFDLCKLAEVRTRKGMTQEGLAQRSKVHVSTIRANEEGKRTAYWGTTYKLAGALDVLPGALMEELP